MKYKDIADQIIELKNKDLELRDKLIENGQLSDGYNKEMAALHNHNAEKLDEIINRIGYPTIDKVGEAGNEAAWLIIQHSIGDPQFMRKCVNLLEDAVRKEKAKAIQLAYLTDRIAVFEDRPQSYGTQYDWDKNGELNPQKYDDKNKVNKRRESLGLNTLEEQTQIMRAQVINENQTPPEDYMQRKREIDRWRKSVGWIK
jgi:hypothetical protein